MSLLSDLEAFSQRKLRPTTTQVTNPLGQTHHEIKLEDGTFQISDQSTTSKHIFMIVDHSPDEQLHHVINGLYIGSQDAAVNITVMNQLKITHILNVATGVENAYPEQFNYLNIELLDCPETNIRRVFERTNEFIKQAIADQGHVLVHCNAGISRSASIVLAYLIKVHRMTYDDAYQLLKTTRPNIRPNDGFVRQLKDYATEIAQSSEHEHRTLLDE